MRFALVFAAIAVLSFPVAAPSSALAADCAANPKAAIKAADKNFNAAKKSMKPESVKAYKKAINKAKMAARTQPKPDVACASLAEAEALLPKK